MEEKKMPAKSRLEINFVRLLEETLNLANGKQNQNWTFEKFVKWLDEKIPEMEKSPNAPNEEKLKHYKRQVEFLKGVLRAEQVSPSQVLESGLSVDRIPYGSATTGDEPLTQQIHHRAKARANTNIRNELLGIGLDGSNLDTLLTESFYDKMAQEETRREKMVEDMIAMTREWKEQSRVAGKVIAKDSEVVSSSGVLADKNQGNLQQETNKLSDYNKRACNCWIWIMLLSICCVFISMVLFIRLFPRKIPVS